MWQFIQKCSVRQWFGIAIFNLLIVGCFGLLMRLKVIFPLAWANQKFLLHAHSHFAFGGWVSHALMIFIVMAICGLKANDVLPPRYRFIVVSNLLASYGMLISFTLQGYGLYAIIFSTLTILLSFTFAWFSWRDIGRSGLPKVIQYWLKAALFFLVFSSLGTFALVYLMVTKQLAPLNQLASVYFYLHFQYNGWFLFSCIGLLLYWLYQSTGKVICSKQLFWSFFACVVPAYFLSVLWWKAFPQWLYVVVVITVLVQLLIWTSLMRNTLRLRSQLLEKLNPTIRIIWYGVMLAVFLKFMLQAASVVPALSKLVYGYRPIVIAYLHLVLLVIVSLFLLGLAVQLQLLRFHNGVKIWLYIVVLGVLFNELILTVQGIGGLVRSYIPGANQLLVIASGMIVVGLVGVLSRQRDKKIPS